MINGEPLALKQQQQQQPDQSKKTAVMVETDLYEDLKRKILGSGFSSVEDYVNYLLRSQIGKKSEELSSEDSEKISSRLKALGYI